MKFDDTLDVTLLHSCSRFGEEKESFQSNEYSFPFQVEL